MGYVGTARSWLQHTAVPLPVPVLHLPWTSLSTFF